MADMAMSEKNVGATGAGQHLAQDGERDHHQHRHLQDRADDAVDVEAEVDEQPLRRHGARLEGTREVRAQEDVDRHGQNDADEAEPRDAAAGFQHQQDQHGAADDALQRHQRDLDRELLVEDGDPAADQQRDERGRPVEPARQARPAADQRPHQANAQDGKQRRRNIAGPHVAKHDVGAEPDRGGAAAPVEPRQARPLRDEGQRQRQAEADGEQLLGIERQAQRAPWHVHHPQHDRRHQRGLQDVGRHKGRPRRGGGELLRAGNQALLAHWIALACRPFSLKYFKAPG